jgi:hypothetical protein
LVAFLDVGTTGVFGLHACVTAGGPYNTPDRATSFGGDRRGYTDYPAR